MQTISIWLLGATVLSIGVVGCGGGGGADSCGKVQPCGGNVAGTWRLSAACTDNAIATADRMEGCPGASIQIANLAVDGALTFTTNLTYTTESLIETFQATETLPIACLNGFSCAELDQMARAGVSATGPLLSVSCTGSEVCVCHFDFSVSAMGEAGTYATSGTALTLVPNDGSGPDEQQYCVQDQYLHLISLSTSMSMGPMGEARVVVDIVGKKQ